MTAMLYGAAYLAGAIGIWRMGPLYELDVGGERELSTASRLRACALWPITLLQMWEPK